MSALIQRSDEWLQLRKSYIGASDMPVIMGDSPWATPFQLWQEKVGIKGKREENWGMKLGNEREPIARAQFEEETEIKMTPTVVFDPSTDYFMASLDGMSDCKKFILEIKSASKEDHELAKKGKVPKKYYAQLQTQLEVTKLPMVYYYSFYKVPSIENEIKYDGVIVEILRDDKYIEKMKVKAEEFKKCVDQHLPPALTDKEKRRAHLKEIQTAAWLDSAYGYMEAKAQQEWWTREVEMLKEKMVVLAGGSDARGAGFKLSKVVTRGRLDYDAILSHFEIDTDLSQFRKPDSESWRITKENE